MYWSWLSNTQFNGGQKTVGQGYLKIPFERWTNPFAENSFTGSWGEVLTLIGGPLSSASVTGEMLVLIRGCSIVHCLLPDSELGPQSVQQKSQVWGVPFSRRFCTVTLSLVHTMLRFSDHPPDTRQILFSDSKLGPEGVDRSGMRTVQDIHTVTSAHICTKTFRPSHYQRPYCWSIYYTPPSSVKAWAVTWLALFA